MINAITSVIARVLLMVGGWAYLLNDHRTEAVVCFAALLVVVALDKD